MSRFGRGQVVLIPFPFTDLKSHKVRPAVIVSPHPTKRGDVIVAFISSVLPFNDVEASAVIIKITDKEFRKTGLKVSSVFRMDKLVTLHLSLMVRQLGSVSSSLQRKLDIALSAALGL